MKCNTGTKIRCWPTAVTGKAASHVSHAYQFGHRKMQHESSTSKNIWLVAPDQVQAKWENKILTSKLRATIWPSSLPKLAFLQLTSHSLQAVYFKTDFLLYSYPLISSANGGELLTPWPAPLCASSQSTPFSFKRSPTLIWSTVFCQTPMHFYNEKHLDFTCRDLVVWNP